MRAITAAPSWSGWWPSAARPAAGSPRRTSKATPPLWAEPITTDYRGYTVCEMPPNGHGITALMALNILRGLELPAEREDARTYHLIAEAIKLAYADTRTYVADPPLHADPGGRSAQRGVRRPGGGR